MSAEPTVYTPQVVEIGPQSGPQTQFAETPADIAIYGGAAGGGKSFGLLLDPLRHHDNADFGAVIFRKTSTQVRNEGGLWDESVKLYPMAGGLPRESTLQWRFASNMSISFGYLEYEKDLLGYQGAQIPMLGFDELTHFSENQFFYMLSRNRSTCGVKPYVRATCNPDPDSWVRKFISWWIGKDGYPIPERSGKIRWFIRLNDKIHWANTPEEIYAQFGKSPEVIPKSVTFIAAKLQDNKILMGKDPAYLGNLNALNRVDRARLRDGNWDIRFSSGDLFKREWFPIIESVPAGWVKAVRFWDRAATKPNEKNKDPDWTRGLKMYKYTDGRHVVADLKSKRDTPGEIENFIKAVASHDGVAITVKSQCDPGSAGKSEAEHFIRSLQGYVVKVETMSKDKATRAKPASSQAQGGSIQVVRAPWNEEFFSELEAFTDDPDDYIHDDIVDVLSGAFNHLSGKASVFDAL